MTGWHFNVKGILKFTGSFMGIWSWDTIKEWEENENFPVRRTPKNRPFVIEEEVKEWFIQYDNGRRAKINK